MNYHRARGGIPLSQRIVEFEEPGANPEAGDGGLQPPSLHLQVFWGEMPGVRRCGGPARAITSLITCLQAPQGTMKWSPMSLPKEKGTELSLVVGEGGNT